MGQKGSPRAFRLNKKKDWDSNWFANKKEFGDLLKKDREIREFLMKKPSFKWVSKIVIKRTSGKIEITIRTARPGLIIGRKGSEIDVLKKELKDFTSQDVWVEIEEIKRPDLDAKLVAYAIAYQIEKRASFRRVMKKAMQTTMDAGAKGVKIQISGRIGGAEIARKEWYKEGKIPLHTIRANIDYAKSTAFTMYGAIGIQVWINTGEE